MLFHCILISLSTVFHLLSISNEKNLITSRKTTNKVKIKGTQIEIVSNNATTGWKLQGATVENLFVKNGRQVSKNGLNYCFQESA